MHHYITNVIIYFLILGFMYVILSSETLVEGKKGLGIQKAVKKTGDAIDSGTDFAKNQAEEAAAKAREAAAKAKQIADEAVAKAKQLADEAVAKAKQLAEEAAKLAEKLLDEALEKLTTGVTRIDEIFSSVKQNLSNVDNISDNFEKDILNSTNYGDQVKANSTPANASDIAVRRSQINNLLNERAKLNQMAQVLNSGPKNAQTSAKANNLLKAMSQLNARLNALI